MSILYLIRHTEPALRGVFLGSTDPGLSEQGRADAARLLAGLEVAAVYTSPLRRARETASAIPAPQPPVVLPELREMGFGDWEGLTWAEIEAGYPEIAQRKIHAWMAVTPPGGETWQEVAARAAAALAIIRRGPFPAAAVAHMVINSALAQQVNGADPLTFSQKYGEVIRCEL